MATGTVDQKIGPAVSAWKSSTGTGYDLFYVQASDHRIFWMRYYDATSTSAAHWSSPSGVNGWTLATPAVVTRSSGVIDLFHTGNDGSVYHKVAQDGAQLTTGSWGRVPIVRSAATTIGPAVSPWSTSSGSGFDLFSVAADTGQIDWTHHQDGTATTQASNDLYVVNGWTHASPAAMSRFHGVTELLHTGTDGGVYYKSAYNAQVMRTGSWTKVPT